MSKHVFEPMIMHRLKNHRGAKYYRVAYGYSGSLESGRRTKIEAKREISKLTKRLQKKRVQRNAWHTPLKFVPKDKKKRLKRHRELNAHYDNVRYQELLDAFNGL